LAKVLTLGGAGLTRSYIDRGLSHNNCFDERPGYFAKSACTTMVELQACRAETAFTRSAAKMLTSYPRLTIGTTLISH
jgi:hypothetical protein